MKKHHSKARPQQRHSLGTLQSDTSLCGIATLEGNTPFSRVFMDGALMMDSFASGVSIQEEFGLNQLAAACYAAVAALGEDAKSGRPLVASFKICCAVTQRDVAILSRIIARQMSVLHSCGSQLSHDQMLNLLHAAVADLVATYGEVGQILTLMALMLPLRDDRPVIIICKDDGLPDLMRRLELSA